MITKNIIAFGASNSKKSINKQFAEFASSKLKGVKVTVLDLNDFDLPLFSIDLENKSGVPENAHRFSNHIKECDAIIISLAEHNSLYTSAFKNLWDWMSRLESPKIWNNKSMFLLSTSPSRKEESDVMKISKELFPSLACNIVSSFHLPSFNHIFKDGQIIDLQQKKSFNAELQKFQTYLNEN